MPGDHNTTGLLAGIRVLDLSIWRPGPYATQLLVEMGAQVIKVEPPGGDPMRVFPALFGVLNAGKRSVALDLKTSAARSAVLDLARRADAVIEGFRPGVVQKLGVGYKHVVDVNPSVVYCSISGYGQDGPLVQLPGHDLNYQSWAGALEPRPGEEEPVVARLPIADLAGGAYAAMAVCAALVRRAATGDGELIDVSMADVIASWTGAAPPVSLPDGQEVGGRVPGYGTFRTADGGWIAVGVISEQHFWSALMRVLGLDDAAELTFAERLKRGDELAASIESAIASRNRDELVADLQGVGAPVSPVLSQTEMLAVAQFRDRGMVADGPDGDPVMHHPLRYRHHPAHAPTDVPPLREGAEHVPSWED